MVYGFANNLPYSIDINQPEYVAADFLNISPYAVESNNRFKNNNGKTFFQVMSEEIY